MNCALRDIKGTFLIIIPYNPVFENVYLKSGLNTTITINHDHIRMETITINHDHIRLETITIRKRAHGIVVCSKVIADAHVTQK